MQQQRKSQQNKSLPSSLFKTAIQFRQKNQEAQKKEFLKTTNQQFNPNNLHWNQSSTSLVFIAQQDERQSSSSSHTKSHQIQHSKKSSNISQFDIYFNLTNTQKMVNNERGVSFAKSTRPQHFVRVNSVNPSPSAYNQSRFLDGINYKTQTPQLKTETSFKTFTSQTTKRKIAKGKIAKGLHFNKFDKYHKQFIEHSKHRPYQPEDTIYIPGPGYYKSTFADKKKEIRYSFKKDANRFKNNKEMKPGPFEYHKVEKKDLSLNAKGTMPKSCRSYLTKFNQTPCPSAYEIPRFLEFKDKK